MLFAGTERYFECRDNDIIQVSQSKDFTGFLAFVTRHIREAVANKTVTDSRRLCTRFAIAGIAYDDNVKCKNKDPAIAEGPRDALCQLKSCQLPCNSAETTCTTSPEQIEVMKLEGYSGPMCNKHVHSTVTSSSRFHCLIGVINKPTTVELCISPVYRQLVVAKFSKSTM